MFGSNLHHSLYILALSIASTSYQFPLDGKSFSLRSVASRIPDDHELVQIHEQYSIEQRRASIGVGINLSGVNDKKFTFYLDSDRSLSALIEEDTFKVERTTPKQLVGLIKSPDLSLESVANDFIIGPARLLFLIEKSRDEMKAINQPIPYEVNGIPWLSYQLLYTLNSGQKLELMVFYSALSSNRDSLPVRVLVFNEADIIMIDYGKFEIIEEDRLYDGREVFSDSFMFRPAYPGLANLVSSNTPELLFASKPIEITKFSFRTTEHFTYFDIDGSASFDGRLKSLRYDFLNSSENGGFQKKQVSNLEMNRLYHTVKRSTSSSSVHTTLDIKTRIDATTNIFGDFEGKCVTARLFPDSAKGELKQLTTGKVLAGSDRFVYLGRARVRGIEARVYEALEPKMPYWLEQPSVYKNAEGGEKVRSPEEDMFFESVKDRTLLHVVLYFAEQNTDHPLLLVEVYKRSAKSLAIYNKRTIFIHEFTWNLDFGVQSDEDQASELFSVHDFCASQSSRYAQIRMLLQSATHMIDSREVVRIDGAEKGDPVSRDVNQIKDLSLVLLGAIQSFFKVPASMIYDTKVRFQGAAQREPKEPQALMTSFKLAEHSDKLSEMLYLGQSTGRFDNNKGYPRGLVTEVPSFQECFFLAAHQNVNIFFRFDPTNFICHIIGSPSLMGQPDWPSCLTKNSMGIWEVYRTNQIKDDTFKTNKLVQKDRNQFKLLGSKFNLMGLDAVIGGDVVQLTVRNLAVEEHRMLADVPSNQKEFNEGDKFPGLGLEDTGRGNEKVAPARLYTYGAGPTTDEHSKSTMTLEQCNAACLSDLDCRSYSLCLKNMEFECVTSSSSFKEPSVISQLNEALADSRRSFEFLVKLPNNDQQIVVHRSASCTLYNVNFLEHFSDPQVVHIPISKRVIHAVSDREQCAEMCMRLSLRVLMEDVDSKATAARTMLESAQFVEESQAEAAKNLSKEHILATNKVCRSFYYLDRGRLDENLRDFVETEAVSDLGNGELSGYCLMTAGSELFYDDIAKKSPPVHTSLDLYSLRFEAFYEKAHGVRLLGSQLSSSEDTAYQLASEQKRAISKEQYSILQRVLKRGDNIQQDLLKDAFACARMCFFQTRGPWPACRSFDIVINLNQGDHCSRCYLNSITLNEAIKSGRTDLIDDRVVRHNRNLQIWHFEPRAGFTLDEANIKENIERASLYSFMDRLDETFGPRIGAFATTCIVLLALIGGSFLCLHLSKRLTEGPLSRSSDDKDALYDVDRQEVELGNQ